MLNDLKKFFSEAKKSLLDLGLRNRLINFKSTSNTITIIDEIPTEIFQILVLNEASMSFKGVKDNSENILFSEDIDLSEDKLDIQQIWRVIPDEDIKGQHKDLILQTNIKEKNLEQKIYKIYLKAKSIYDELGHNILYLAISFLEWKDVNYTQNIISSPLILIPVLLYRTKVRSAFKIKWNGEDIITNISLKEKLFEQGINIPDFSMPDSKEEINIYIQKVKDEIKDKKDWNINNKIFLGFFSFSKFIMYKDLDVNSWPKEKNPFTNPIIQNLMEPEKYINLSDNFNEFDIDIKLNVEKIFHVMDADPSQIAAIEDVKNGKNLVIQGPPGTGKSQTITNIIAELLAQNKKVLFVSEKMAALDVVKKRLDSVGLGDFCLELHSNKTNKKIVIEKLGKLIQSDKKTLQEDFDFDLYENLKLKLNEYAHSLKKIIGNSGFNLQYLIGLREKNFSKINLSEEMIPNFNFSSIDLLTKNNYKNAINILQEFQSIYNTVSPINKNPWRWCNPINLFPNDINEIEKNIQNSKIFIHNIYKLLLNLNKFTGIKIPENLKQIDDILNAANIVAFAKPNDKSVFLNSDWNKCNKLAETLIQKIEEYQEIDKIISLKFNLAFEESYYNFVFDKFNRYLNSKLSFIYPNYYKCKNQIKRIYRNQNNYSNYIIVQDLLLIKKYFTLKNYIRKNNNAAIQLFGVYWNNEISIVDNLKVFSKWIIHFRNYFLKNIITLQSVNIIIDGISKDKIENIVNEIKKIKDDLIKVTFMLNCKLRPNYEKYIFIKSIEDVSLKEMYSLLDFWGKNINKLHCWMQYLHYRNQYLESIIKPIVVLVEDGTIQIENSIPIFIYNFCNSLIKLSFQTNPIQATFIGELHQNHINRFQKFDKELLSFNQKRLSEMLFIKLLKEYKSSTFYNERSILLHEINKKRKHLSIRNLIIETGKLIQQLQPCFMMSPLSVAQYLEQSAIDFDIVLFDEASQVKPADSLGSILRAKQLVVLGDTKQLPPTSFFDNLINSENEDEDEYDYSAMETESILHLCNEKFSSKMLKWHYRSRHESLIAVSNHQFYDQKLLIYPSAINKADFIGLHLKYIPDSIYDRGRTQINKEEAKIIAKDVINHYQLYPNKSIGIGTFSVKQQQAILDEIEIMLRLHPEYEDLLKSSKEEPFFVKNLETIQGDERDVIFISIGYGYDLNKKLSLNFGPLNHLGGERRLNVLISRAREKCIVYSNFKANDLNIGINSSIGMQSLKVFLNYAENRSFDSNLSNNDFDSPFEESVYIFLKAHGYKVHNQVGCAGFRIDLAILDDNNSGSYILGIECDGSKYHSSPIARDRDRLRQQILENLGWSIYRIWSTDWFRSRKDAQKKLIENIEKIRKQKSPNYVN